MTALEDYSADALEQMIAGQKEAIRLLQEHIEDRKTSIKKLEALKKRKQEE